MIFQGRIWMKKSVFRGRNLGKKWGAKFWNIKGFVKSPLQRAFAPAVTMYSTNTKVVTTTASSSASAMLKMWSMYEK